MKQSVLNSFQTLARGLGAALATLFAVGFFLVSTGTAQADDLIRSRVNTDKCLHKKNGDFNNGNPIHLWDCAAGGDDNKAWVYDPATSYIRSKENMNKCMHKKDGNFNNGNLIHLWDCDAGGTNNKTWIYESSTGYIRAKENQSKCMHKKDGNFNNGNVIHLWDCSAGGDGNKSWNLESAERNSARPAQTSSATTQSTFNDQTGLLGYVSMNVDNSRELLAQGYGYGVSWYSTQWELTDQRVRAQFGLPGSWVLPDPKGVDAVLCPADRAELFKCSGDFCVNRFQSVEGGMGAWYSTQFASQAPKFRMNSTPDCYKTEISTPGWRFRGSSKSLSCDAMGMAQLSNRLVIPPDGVTFESGPNGLVMGSAWMNMPLPDVGYFKLKTKFLEAENKCLEGNRVAAGSTLGGASFMNGCANQTGQFWKLKPVTNQSGYFWLQTKFEGDDKCLEGNKMDPASYLKGAAFMNTCGFQTGQFWKFESANNGYYRLKTMFLGKDKCLEGNKLAAGSTLNGASFMADCRNEPGQYWKMEELTTGTATVPTGNYNWTLFMNTENFKGPAAFYIPETFSKLSRTHTPATGMGLDARLGSVGSLAMESVGVPGFFEESGGVWYSKIPKIGFPTDGPKRTTLVQDLNLYKAGALYEPMMQWIQSGAQGNPPSGFGASSARTVPNCSGNPFSLTQEVTGFDKCRGLPLAQCTGECGNSRGSCQLKLTGFGATSKLFDTKTCSWGLEWTTPGAKFTSNGKTQAFPEYYKFIPGVGMQGAMASEVPQGLQSKTFPAPGRGATYTSPGNGCWVPPSTHPRRGPFNVTLSDNSVVTYYWYRFIDQPALQQLHLSDAMKAQMQSIAEGIHEGWKIDGTYFPNPSSGTALVSLDSALLVTPPADIAKGWVPIVTEQRAGN